MLSLQTWGNQKCNCNYILYVPVSRQKPVIQWVERVALYKFLLIFFLHKSAQFYYLNCFTFVIWGPIKADYLTHY